MGSVTERQVLAALIKEAKVQGLLALRLHAGPGAEVGWPDVMLVGAEKVMFVETKRPGGKLRPIQALRLSAIREKRHGAQVVYSVDEAREVARGFAKECACA